MLIFNYIADAARKCISIISQRGLKKFLLLCNFRSCMIFNILHRCLIFQIFDLLLDPDLEPEECGANELWHDPNNTNVCMTGCMPGKQKTMSFNL